MQFEGVLHQIMSIGACSIPLGALLTRLYFEPIIVISFIVLNIHYQSFELLLQSIFPLGVFRTCVNSQEGYFISRLLYTAYHCSILFMFVLYKINSNPLCGLVSPWSLNRLSSPCPFPSFLIFRLNLYSQTDLLFWMSIHYLLSLWC